MIDVTEQISAVRREVGGRVLEAGQARVVTGGTITRCDPPHGFDAAWEMGGDAPGRGPSRRRPHHRVLHRHPWAWRPGRPARLRL